MKLQEDNVVYSMKPHQDSAGDCINLSLFQRCPKEGRRYGLTEVSGVLNLFCWFLPKPPGKRA